MKRKLDIATVIGTVLVVGLIIFGIVFTEDIETGKTSINFLNILSFFNLASIFIVIGGTFGCLFLMFPLSQFKKIPKHLKIIIFQKQYNPGVYIEFLVECAKVARTKGLLALEENIAIAEDSFMKKALQMVVDSVDPEKVKEQLEAWMDNIDERHSQEASFYDKGAALGPAFGMIGTLIGLVNMLKSLDNIETVGPNMAVALITTFYGSLLANVVFAPISNKLRVVHEDEYLCMKIISEGVQAIQAGENPNLIYERLLYLLPDYQKAKLTGDSGSDDGEGKKKGKAKKEKKK